MHGLPIWLAAVTTQFELPTGAPTWPPCVTYRTSSGHTSMMLSLSVLSCRPPPVTRQEAPTVQHRPTCALQGVPCATMFEPLMSQTQLVPSLAASPLTRI